MNKIAYLAAGVAAGDRARARIHQQGCAPGGSPLWTAKDNEVLKQIYPDYRAAMAALNRTYAAVRAQAQKLGLTPKRNRWTGNQLSRLRKLYRASAPTAALIEAFPDRKLDNIYCMARYFGLKRSRKPYVPTGILVIDQIRARCFELCLSMADLDEMARSGSYFSKAAWHADGLNARAIARAVRALDGQLAAVWNEYPPQFGTPQPPKYLRTQARQSVVHSC